MRHWKPGLWQYSLLELQESMEYCVCMWYLGGAPLLLSKEFLRDLGCRIDLGRGHLFFEKLGVRTVVRRKQSPHLLLPLTSFGPQGHKIPAEIQPRISSDECAVYRAICDSSGQNKIHSWIASTSDHQAPETDSTCTESLHGTDGQEKNSCDEARDYWENREGRWVSVHSIARRTLFDPLHDEQPFCHNLTERRRTTVRFLGQQNELLLVIPGHKQVRCEACGRARQSFGHPNDMPQDVQNPVASTEHECRDSHLPAVSHTEKAEEEGTCVVLGLPKLFSVYSNHHDDSSGATESRRQGRNHGNQQVHTVVVGVRRGGATFQPEDGGTHRTGSISRRGQLRQEEAEKAPLEEQSVQNKVIETAFRREQAMEKMSLITKLSEVNLEPACQ